jgi:D-alanyl-D-alanine carboxypeptidase
MGLVALAVVFLALVAVLIVAQRLYNDTRSTPARHRAVPARPPAQAPKVIQLAPQPVAPGPGGLKSAPLVVKLVGPHNLVRPHFQRPPRSGLLFDLNSGRVLWREKPIRTLPIASLTKMMTALLVVRSAPPSDRVRITRQALAYKGSAVGVLPRNKDVRLETLLNGLMLPSGNDAAIALAQHVGGTVSHFVTRMNSTAAGMGLRCTRFASPDGYNDAGRSCAADLAVLARADLGEPRIARVVRRRLAVEPLPIKGGRVYLFNNNPLIRLGYPGIDGLKTGYTVAAGHCLVATARRHGVWLGAVLLNSPDTGRQARALLDEGFRIE